MFARRRVLEVMGSAAIATGFSPRFDLLLAAAAGGPMPRVDLEKFSADPLKVTTLKKAVASMKARNPSDPTSWFFQAAIHGVTPAAIAAAQQIDPDIAKVDQHKLWNQCPHFKNASSAEFLIWHRAYLYYFERILREASGDPTLTLPYWNYGDHAQRGCPKIFSNPEKDASGIATNSLFDARREASFVTGYSHLTKSAVSTDIAFSQSTFFGSTANAAFGGAINDLEPDNQGTLEQSPHGWIHFVVGGVISDQSDRMGPHPAVGLMAYPPTSAFDPLFWVHHSNIDRLWSVWDCLPGKTWGPAPPKAWWDAAPWWFYDFDKTVHNHPRSQYVSARSLGIVFDTDDLACSPLSSTPLPVADAATVATMSATQKVVARSEGGLLLSAEAPVGKTVSLGPAAEILQAAKIQSGRPGQVFLQLTGVAYDSPPSVAYKIYVNLESANGTRQSDAEFVGTLNLFGLGHRSHEPTNETGGQIFDISHLASTADFDPSSVRITFVPFDLLGTQEGMAPIRRAGGLRLGGILITITGEQTPPKQ
jgi:hypothetical protein